MDVYLKNPATGEKKKRKRGFSWTTLFFGFWPAVFRADWKWALIGFAITWPLGFLTLGLSGVIYGIWGGFSYNGWHLNDLRDKGFVEIAEAEFYNQPTLATQVA